LPVYNSDARTGVTLPGMTVEKRFEVIQLPELKWPTSLRSSSGRFRLFVAADIHDIGTDVVSEFASSALSSGMVYFCAWGRDCEQFHDIVDAIVVKDQINERRFVGPNANDTVMTTWHEDESLEEALDFFIACAVPTEGFVLDSSFRLVICVGNAEWAGTATRLLESTNLLT
jgi:hypothetical protein